MTVITDTSKVLYHVCYSPVPYSQLNGTGMYVKGVVKEQGSNWVWNRYSPFVSYYCSTSLILELLNQDAIFQSHLNMLIIFWASGNGHTLLPISHRKILYKMTICQCTQQVHQFCHPPYLFINYILRNLLLSITPSC